MKPAAIQVRLATDPEGPEIGAMVGGRAGGDLRWDRVYPNWLVAEDMSGLMACCMILTGRPFGTIEFLSFRKGLPATQKALAIRKMAPVALALLQAAGCQAAFGLVPKGVESWRRTLYRKWRATPLSKSCEMFVKRLG